MNTGAYVCVFFGVAVGIGTFLFGLREWCVWVNGERIIEKERRERCDRLDRGEVEPHWRELMDEEDTRIH
jgi:hypothetical protein